MSHKHVTLYCHTSELQSEQLLQSSLLLLYIFIKGGVSLFWTLSVEQRVNDPKTNNKAERESEGSPAGSDQQHIPH